MNKRTTYSLRTLEHTTKDHSTKFEGFRNVRTSLAQDIQQIKNRPGKPATQPLNAQPPVQQYTPK